MMRCFAAASAGEVWVVMVGEWWCCLRWVWEEMKVRIGDLVNAGSGAWVRRRARIQFK